MRLAKLAVGFVVACALAASPVMAGIEGQTETEQKAIKYLLGQQEDNGAWLSKAGPAPTAMVVKGLLRAGYTVNDEPVKKGLAFIDKTRRDKRIKARALFRREAVMLHIVLRAGEIERGMRDV